MNEDDLKRYTVQVATGSGCLLQPLSGDHTYILTARHLFCDQQNVEGITNFIDPPDGQMAVIKYYEHSGSEWKMEEFKLPLTRGETYFPHTNLQVDAAILKIHHIKNFDQIIIYQDHKTPDGFKLCGHPSNRRNQPDPYTSYTIESSIASTNFGQTVQLALGNTTQDHINGMSGGGILKTDRSAILIAGIQSKMASVILPAGQVAFVPIKYYAEVVESHASQLEKLPASIPQNDFPPVISKFNDLKAGILGDRRFSASLISLFLCISFASIVFCILSSDSQTRLGVAIAAITFILSIIFYIQFRSYRAKIIAHDLYVDRYGEAPPPPHYEIEKDIIANAKNRFL